MKWRWILALLSLTFLLVFGAAGIVATFVPVRFTVTAEGRVRPAHEVRVTAAQSGLALEVRAPGAVAAGDILIRQKSDSEQRLVEALDRQIANLVDRIALEERRLAREEELAQIDAQLLVLEQQETERRLQHVQRALPSAEDAVRLKTLAQQQIRRDLAQAEYQILQRLAEEQSVPQQEVARGKAQAETAELLVQQTTLEAARDLVVRNDVVRALEARLETLRAQTRRLDALELDRQRLVELQGQVESLRTERAETLIDIEQKTLRAPWAGQWMDVAVATDEYVTQGQFVGLLVDMSQLVFEGRLRENRVAWVRPEQPAQIRVNAFPYLKYGTLNGSVRHVAPQPEAPAVAAGGALPAALPDYGIELALESQGQPFQPRPGQTGRADIRVYRGSLIQWVMAEPGSEGAKPLSLRELFQRHRQ